MPSGSNAIVEIQGDESVRHVLPEPWSVGTTVYEYGGQAYAILPGDASGEGLKIIFSHAKDNSCNVLDVDAEVVRTLRESDTLRYGDFHPHPDPSQPWVLAVEEDHEKPRPEDVRNYIVAINVQTAAVKRVVAGADFYSYPRFSPDGTKVSFRQWNHPDLPFKGVTLHWGTWNPDGAVENPQLVAGEDGQCVGELSWSPDGTLFFSQERSGVNFRQLFKVKPGASGTEQVKLKGLEDVEVGNAQWEIGW